MSSPFQSEWAQAIVSTHIWEIDPTKPREQGEAAGFFVRSSQTPTAYLKPGQPSSEDDPRAAYEKIKSDLAFALGQAVPSVLLLVNPNLCLPPAARPREVRCCVVAAPQATVYRWNVLEQAMQHDAVLRKQAEKAAGEQSGMAALDLWTDGQDRDNIGNVLFANFDGYEDGAFLFIDNARCLNWNKQWADIKTRETLRSPELYRNGSSLARFFQRNFNKQKALEVATAINGFSDSLIVNIVNRIPSSHPDEYLSEANKRLAISGLQRRKSAVYHHIEANL